jgi:hypothetical protein
MKYIIVLAVTLVFATACSTPQPPAAYYPTQGEAPIVNGHPYHPPMYYYNDDYYCYQMYGWLCIFD